MGNFAIGEMRKMWSLHWVKKDDTEIQHNRSLSYNVEMMLNSVNMNNSGSIW